MKFRPCIDLRRGKVVQIVGSTLRDSPAHASKEEITNFESERSSAEFATLYKDDALTGGHVIKLGEGNEEAAVQALRAYPGGLQVGGGVTSENAKHYLKEGASHVIVTSFVFRDGEFDESRVKELVAAVGKDKLVLDLSCRKKDGNYYVVTDRWQKFTALKVDAECLEYLAQFCSEFLVHGVDVEGKQQGIEVELVRLLGSHSPIPVTYAGGIRSMEDLELVNREGGGKVDATVGSALDIFGGNLAYKNVVQWSNEQ